MAGAAGMPEALGGADSGADGGGAANDTGAGQPSEAGSSATLGCEAPSLDCDGSTLTLCETDANASPAHCGGCNQPCVGICSNGACTPFEVVATGLHDPEPALALTRDFVFFAGLAAAGSTDGPDLLRVSRATGLVEVIAQRTFAQVKQLVAAGTRLYVADGARVRSLTLAGAELREESIEANALAAHDGNLYFTQDDGLYRKALTGGPSELVQSVLPASPELAADGEILVLGTRDLIDDTYHHRIYTKRRDEQQLVGLAEGTGRLASVLAANGEAYWIVEVESGLELRRAKHDAVRLGAGADPAEIAVGGDLVIAAWTQGGRPGLQLVPLVAPSDAQRFETVGALRSFVYADNLLWFFDTKQRTLLRSDPRNLFLRALDRLPAGSR